MKKILCYLISVGVVLSFPLVAKADEAFNQLIKNQMR